MNIFTVNKVITVSNRYLPLIRIFTAIEFISEKKAAHRFKNKIEFKRKGRRCENAAGGLAASIFSQFRSPPTTLSFVIIMEFK